MKALFLHGLDGHHEENWMPWLAAELRQRNWQVWVPDLPRPDEPNTERSNAFLTTNLPWALDDQTVIVCHSAGSLAGLALLQAVPGVQIAMCVLVGAFKDDLGLPHLHGLFETPYDFIALRGKARGYVLFHSDDDPYCPLEHAEYLAEQLQGELRMEPGQGHFSASTQPPYFTFPALLDVVLSVSAP